MCYVLVHHFCFAQLQAVHADVRIPVGGGNTRGVRCYLTGDGKAMLAANYAAGHSCWVCSAPRSSWAATMRPSPDLSHHLRYGAFLRDIPHSRALGVGDRNVVNVSFWGWGMQRGQGCGTIKAWCRCGYPFAW